MLVTLTYFTPGSVLTDMNKTASPSPF